MAEQSRLFLILCLLLICGETPVQTQSQYPNPSAGYPSYPSPQQQRPPNHVPSYGTGGQYPTSQTNQFPGQTPGTRPGQTGSDYPSGQQYPTGTIGTGNQYPVPGQTGTRYPQTPGTAFPGASVRPGACPPMVLPPYGRYLQGPCGSNAGDRCYLTCDPGFDIVGSCFRVCNNGRWSGTKLICAKTSIRCPSLTVHPGIKLVDGCQNMAGFSCELGCMSGTRPLGQNVIYCSAMGQWSSPAPTCPSSGGAGMLPGGQIPGQLMIPGQGSMPGKEMNGGTGGQSQFCPLLQPPIGGMINGQCLSSPGSMCRVVCNPGYRLEGSETRTCTASGWSPAIASRCLPTTGSPNGLDQGSGTRPVPGQGYGNSRPPVG